MKNNLVFEFKKGDGKFQNVHYKEKMDDGILKRISDPKQRRSLYDLRERLEKRERGGQKHGA